MSTPKHNVTVAIEAALLAKARALAAQRRQSISALLAGCLRQIVDDDARYLLARGPPAGSVCAPPSACAGCG